MTLQAFAGAKNIKGCMQRKPYLYMACVRSTINYCTDLL